MSSLQQFPYRNVRLIAGDEPVAQDAESPATSISPASAELRTADSPAGPSYRRRSVSPPPTARQRGGIGEGAGTGPRNRTDPDVDRLRQAGQAFGRNVVDLKTWVVETAAAASRLADAKEAVAPLENHLAELQGILGYGGGQYADLTHIERTAAQVAAVEAHIEQRRRDFKIDEKEAVLQEDVQELLQARLRRASLESVFRARFGAEPHTDPATRALIGRADDLLRTHRDYLGIAADEGVTALVKAPVAAHMVIGLPGPAAPAVIPATGPAAGIVLS